MYENFGYNPYRQQPSPVPQASPQFVVRQVGNIEEARSCLIDPLNIWLFVDMQSGKIYMKRMGNNGMSLFDVFAVEQPPIPQAQIASPDKLKDIESRLSALEKSLGVKEPAKEAEGAAV